jgi:hypothetical protein
MDPLIIACAVTALAAGAATWKGASWWYGAQLETKDARIKGLHGDLGMERQARDDAEAQLARERVLWSAEEDRRDNLERRLREDVDALRKALHDAASRDPALAGARLDDVLSRGRASLTARGNAAAPDRMLGTPAAPARAPGDDDPAR